MERRLAAVLAMDVVGFSRQTEADEEGTLHRLKALRAELLDPQIAAYQGRLVEIRIGINLGDIVFDDDDIYGDGVNVAARLEGLAQPGGICISGTAYDHVRGKTDVTFEDLGAQQVKNISTPIRTYRVIMDGAAAPAPNPAKSKRGKLTVYAGAAIAVALIAALAIWQPWQSRAGLELPDKPSIAVLPFDNLNNDETQEYFSDGMTEDLINNLSRYRELFVIARNSSFVYKDSDAGVKEIARELGVAYVVDGSIRRGDNRVRINVQLVDARGGNEIWAEQFDREMTDVFEVQDEITRSLAGQLVPEVIGAEITTARDTPTEDLDSWDLYLQAIAAEATYSAENMNDAIRLAEAAIAQDPAFSAPYVVISRAKGLQYFYGWTENAEQTLNEALAAAERAIILDDRNASAYAALGYNYRYLRDEPRSVANLERAISLNPNDANIRLQFAHVLDWFRLQERGLDQINEAIRLSPRDPRLQLMYFYKAHILFHLKRFEESLEASEQMAAALTSDLWRLFYHQIRATNLAQLGELEDARAEIEAAREINPKLTLSFVRQLFNIANNHPENRDFWLESLKLCDLGMPASRMSY